MRKNLEVNQSKASALCFGSYRISEMESAIESAIKTNAE